MIVTNNNVIEGQQLYIVPSDKREYSYSFTVGKIGRKYIFDEWGVKRIEVGTNEIYRKDGIGSPEYVYLNEEEYKNAVIADNVRKNFWCNIEMCHNIRLSDHDMSVIKTIMENYGYKWKNDF